MRKQKQHLPVLKVQSFVTMPEKLQDLRGGTGTSEDDSNGPPTPPTVTTTQNK